MRMSSVRRNPGDAARVKQVKEHLDFYLKLMHEAAYEDKPSLASALDLMHAIRMLAFFRGRAVELDIDDPLSDYDSEEIDALAQDLARQAAKAMMAGFAQKASLKANGRRRVL